MKKTRILTGAIFIIFTMLWTQCILMPQYTGEINEGRLDVTYYNNPTKHDVIFIGDCEVYDNFSPIVLWEDYGINSYIRGSAQQLIWQSYYLLEDTLRYETPQAVVFNVLSMQYGTPQKESYNRLTLDEMRWSISKLKSILVSMTEEESLIEYLIPLLRYHSRWNEVDIKKLISPNEMRTKTYNGYYLHKDIKAVEDMPVARILDSYRLPEVSYKYLDKMTKLCKEKGIELILIKSPSIYPIWYDEWNEQISQYAEENNIHYINFIKENDDVGIDYRIDTYDSGQHLNVFGAEKAARYLGRILRDELGINNRRGDTLIATQWEDEIEKYNLELGHIVEAYSLEYDISEIVSCMKPELVYEIGSEFPEAWDFFDFEKNDLRIPQTVISKIDFVDSNTVYELCSEIGRHAVEIQYGESVINTYVNVVDTTAPVISVPELTEYNLGEAIQYKKDVRVTDNSGILPELMVDDEDVTINVPGTYKVCYTATDNAGNSSRAYSTIIIKDNIEVNHITSEVVDALAESVLNEIIQDGMSERDCLYAVFRWCRENISRTSTSRKDDFLLGAFEGLRNKAGDCYIYNATAVYLIQKLGYDVVTVSKKHSATVHYWLLVNTSQGWYHFDCYTKKGIDCFLLTDKQVKKKSVEELGDSAYYRFDEQDIPKRATEEYK